jgi:hypothetical protein
MDWNKIGAIGSLGSFVMGAVLFLVQVWPVPQWRAKTASVQLFAPRLLGLVLVIGFLLAALSIYLAWQKPPQMALKWTKTQADEQLVYGQSFRNESVEIDGKKFDHCKFENVTIVFHALAPADFLECQWTGAIYLKTDNDGAKGFMMLMEQMRHTPGLSMFKVGSVDNKGNIMPIAPGVPIDQSPTGPK